LFPDPNPALAELTRVTEEYKVALYNAKGLDTLLVSIKNDLRAVLRSMLSREAEYVMSVAKGDRTVLLASGFTLAKVKGEVTALKPIEKLMVNTEIPEQAVLRVKKVIGAKAYVYQYTVDAVGGESQWVSRTVTEPSFTLSGLQPGIKHLFRVIAVGPGDQSVYSPVVSRFIQ
ncbi:MAG TPA: fibronectin type III domain-containing protein, partial [Niastella sp.]|nr:fibronectin type III domain-containing protein [Niastella sp.]